MNDKPKAVKLTDVDLLVVEAIQRKLGIRNVSEVLRMGLRALAREHQLDHICATQPTNAT
jgi:hypothetical protein